MANNCINTICNYILHFNELSMKHNKILKNWYSTNNNETTLHSYEIVKFVF